MVLYPVQNRVFWASMGYADRHERLLPAEELEAGKDGSLIPETVLQDGARATLPRWEKLLSRDYPHPEPGDGACKRRKMELREGENIVVVDTPAEATWKALDRNSWPLWRQFAASASSISGEELQRRVESSVKESQQWYSGKKRQSRTPDLKSSAKGKTQIETCSDDSHSSPISLAAC